MRDFSQVKRVVVKVGTHTLAGPQGIDEGTVGDLARQIHELRRQDRQVVLVSSGAIGMGSHELRLPGPVKTTRVRQACAAVGQPLLMAAYRRAFAAHDLTVAQVLLTAEVLDHRRTYLNLRTAIETLLDLGVMPVINENDCVSTEEIGTAFGDNDRLGALVASKLDAGLLILLSDVDGLYSKNPQQHPDARPIETVTEVTDEIWQMARGKGGPHATGGMRTKLQAAQIAARSGCRMVLAHGRTPDVLPRILAGERIGTVFLAGPERLSNRSRWILHSAPQGRITVDEGALAAIRQHKSLLPSGVTAVQGTFQAGDVIEINEHFKARASLSSEQIAAIMGHHSSEVRTVLGPHCRDVVALPEDIVPLD